MTKQELIARLRELAEFSETDAKSAHEQADYLLLEYIGDQEISDVYETIQRWFA